MPHHDSDRPPTTLLRWRQRSRSSYHDDILHNQQWISIIDQTQCEGKGVLRLRQQGTTAMRMCPPLLASLYLQLHATAQSPKPQQHNVMSTSIITYTATDRYTDTVPGMEFCTLSQIVNICTSWTENSSILRLNGWQHTTTPQISMFIREFGFFWLPSSPNRTSRSFHAFCLCQHCQHGHGILAVTWY